MEPVSIFDDTPDEFTLFFSEHDELRMVGQMRCMFLGGYEPDEEKTINIFLENRKGKLNLMRRPLAIE